MTQSPGRRQDQGKHKTTHQALCTHCMGHWREALELSLGKGEEEFGGDFQAREITSKAHPLRVGQLLQDSLGMPAGRPQTFRKANQRPQNGQGQKAGAERETALPGQRPAPGQGVVKEDTFPHWETPHRWRHGGLRNPRRQRNGGCSKAKGASTWETKQLGPAKRSPSTGPTPLGRRTAAW